MGQWPSPKEYPLPCPVQARQSSRKRLITASVIMLVGAPFLIFSLQGLFGAYDLNDRWSPAAASRSMLIGTVVLWKWRRQKGSREPDVEFIPQGVTAQACFKGVIPGATHDYLTAYVTIGEQAWIQPTATTTSTLASTLWKSGGNGAAEFPRCIRQSIKSTFGNGGQPDAKIDRLLPLTATLSHSQKCSPIV